jgi:hypothetical protein
MKKRKPVTWHAGPVCGATPFVGEVVWELPGTTRPYRCLFFRTRADEYGVMLEYGRVIDGVLTADLGIALARVSEWRKLVLTRGLLPS